MKDMKPIIDNNKARKIADIIAALASLMGVGNNELLCWR